MSENTTAPIGDIDLLSVWDGPAEHAPGVLFEVPQAKDKLLGEGALAELAGWVALAALSGVIGNAVYEAIKGKVRDVLKSWRHVEGQARLDELKRHVSEEMQKHRANGKLTAEELRNRIDDFFQEVRG
jgi:hypothetical protein